MHPFTVSWDEATLDRIRRQVRDYRVPPTPERAGWRYGCDPDFLRALCAYWADGYDARAAEADLNRFPQVLHRVEEIDLHAVLVGEAQRDFNTIWDEMEAKRKVQAGASHKQFEAVMEAVRKANARY